MSVAVGEWTWRVSPFVCLYPSHLPKRSILHFIFQNKLHYCMLLWCSVRVSHSHFCFRCQKQHSMELQSNAIKLLQIKIKQMCSQTAWLEWKWEWIRICCGNKVQKGQFVAAKFPFRKLKFKNTVWVKIWTLVHWFRDAAMPNVWAYERMNIFLNYFFKLYAYLKLWWGWEKMTSASFCFLSQLNLHRTI